MNSQRPEADVSFPQQLSSIFLESGSLLNTELATNQLDLVILNLCLQGVGVPGGHLAPLCVCWDLNRSIAYASMARWHPLYPFSDSESLAFKENEFDR